MVYAIDENEVDVENFKKEYFSDDPRMEVIGDDASIDETIRSGVSINGV